MVNLILGDCLDEIKRMESESVDALITDPPAGISFMGKSWDHHRGGRDSWIEWMQGVMTECLRVLKPGAHGLVWALPRTTHWTATALENAGFEVRDTIVHIFGSGFPKSLNIGKAIDKAAGVEREVIWGYKLTGKARVLKGNNFDGGYEGKELSTHFDITSPASPEAKKWDGWGTALKPAHENWILVRKPLSEKTVAANVLKHGTGGINVDACRIAHNGNIEQHNTPSKSGLGKNGVYGDSSREQGADSETRYHSTGRFPANLILSEESAAELDAHSGELKNGGQNYAGKIANSCFGNNEVTSPTKFAGDTGGASRFFYVAKASKRDKGADNTHPTVKNTKLMEYLITLITAPGGTVLDPFMGSGSTGVAAQRLGFGFVGIEAEADYFAIAKARIDGDQ